MQYYTSELFEEMGWDKKIILVTSSMHSKRARLCFEKAGFTVTSFDADPVKSVRPITLKDIFVPDIGCNRWLEKFIQGVVWIICVQTKGIYLKGEIPLSNSVF